MTNQSADILNLSKQVITAQLNSLEAVLDRLDKSIVSAVQLILSCSGRVIISGMGKSGLVGRKIVSTLSSTGTPASFVHPAEAFHGDLGMIKKDDCVILISYSGNTDEIIKMIPFLKSQNNIVIAMTGITDSFLSEAADVTINIAVEREACFHNLAPSSSTTVTMALGDAIALVASQIRGFKPEDFARFHPGGSLGKKLLSKVKDVMRTGPFLVFPEISFLETVERISDGMIGTVIVIDQDSILQGIVTSGDIRRAMQAHRNDCFALKAANIMNSRPIQIDYNAKLYVAEELFLQHNISSLVVTKDLTPVGILLAQDMV